MQIITIYPRGFGSNCYVLTEDGENAIVIDPAQPRVESELIKRGLKAACVLLTHCHFDHVDGVSALQQSGAKVLCSTEEKPFIGTSVDMYEWAYKYAWENRPRNVFQVNDTFFDGEEKEFCGIKVKAIFTPGHTKGSVCYLVTAKDGGRYLFTGDTLFQGCVGRTDLLTGSAEDMRASLRKLSALEGDYPIYPGHNEATTLGEEMKINPFMQDL